MFESLKKTTPPFTSEYIDNLDETLRRDRLASIQDRNPDKEPYIDRNSYHAHIVGLDSRMRK